MNTITEKNLASYLDGSLPLLLYFWQPRSIPCAQIGVDLQKIEADFASRIVVGKVSTNEEIMITRRYNVDVTPTLLLLRERVVRGQKYGYLPVRDIKVWLENLI